MIFLLLSSWLSVSWATDLAHSTAWLNLIHYQKTFTGFESEADGAAYFLASDGKTNPAAELKATIEALSDTTKLYGKLKGPAACVFTSRKLFLERLGYKFPSVSCPEYQTWRESLPVERLSLVFAAGYPNNPASMFGHTFLRLNGPGVGKTLLDYAVNFAATTGSDGGVEFAVLGVFGGYEGHYSLAPYFIKVNEYNNSEARDLWEYPLTLSKDAIDLLLAHLWELESATYFDYYFFDENCSWQILRLLEAVEPKLKLAHKAPFYIIPGETVQILAQEKLLGEPVFRPSLRREFIAEQDPALKELLKMRIAERKGKLTDKERYHELLVARAQRGESVQATPVQVTQTRPDLGHELRRVSFTQGDHFWRLSLRMAHHDLLDADIGHEEWSTLDVLRGTFEEREGRVFTRELVLAEVVSLHNLVGLGFEPSWNLKFGALNPREFQCSKCLSAGVDAGLGLSWHESSWLAAVFIQGQAQGMKPYESGAYFATGPRVMLGRAFGNVKLLTTAQKLYNDAFDTPGTLELSSSWSLHKAFSVRGHIVLQEEERPLESGVSVLYYF